MSESKLSALQPGESATIQAISAEEALHHRLLAMGFRVGREVSLVRRAGFRGPVQIRVGTTEVIMRRAEADKIRIAQSR